MSGRGPEADSRPTVKTQLTSTYRTQAARPSGSKLLARSCSWSDSAAYRVCGCLLRMAVARVGCGTSLLYRTTGASKNSFKGPLTSALLHSQLRRRLTASALKLAVQNSMATGSALGSH
jgi:hypothetical protein